MNLEAFRLGRVAAHDPAALARRDAVPAAAPDAEAEFARLLERYQDAAYAKRYRDFVAEVAREEASKAGARGAVTETVARNLGRLMSYKDEYEVARLLTSPEFAREIEEAFGAGAKATYHLAPPLLASRRDAAGRPRKLAFGSWLRGPMALLARMKGLRGTPLDVFGRTGERRRERAAIATYEQRVRAAIAGLTPANRAAIAAALDYPERIRGYGPVKEASFARAEAAWAEASKALAGGD
jgi:indolepyruvate ferredoxin oxidoreductase